MKIKETEESISDLMGNGMALNGTYFSREGIEWISSEMTRRGVERIAYKKSRYGDALRRMDMERLSQRFPEFGIHRRKYDSERS